MHSQNKQINTQIARFMGANMGPTWVLEALDGPHVGSMNFTIRVDTISAKIVLPTKVCLTLQVWMWYYFVRQTMLVDHFATK